MPNDKPQTTLTWETFCDESYYHLWCVRRKTEREFGQAYHVVDQQEANHLLELLNRVAP